VNENFASVSEGSEFAVISVCIFWFRYFTHQISPIMTKWRTSSVLKLGLKQSAT